MWAQRDSAGRKEEEEEAFCASAKRVFLSYSSTLGEAPLSPP